MDISSAEISFMVFRRVTRDDAGEFSLDGQMLSVLMELDGQKSVAVVAKNTGLSMGTVGKEAARQPSKISAISENFWRLGVMISWFP